MLWKAAPAATVKVIAVSNLEQIVNNLTGIEVMEPINYPNIAGMY